MHIHFHIGLAHNLQTILCAKEAAYKKKYFTSDFSLLLQSKIILLLKTDRKLKHVYKITAAVDFFVNHVFDTSNSIPEPIRTMPSLSNTRIFLVSYAFDALVLEANYFPDKIIGRTTDYDVNVSPCPHMILLLCPETQIHVSHCPFTHPLFPPSFIPSTSHRIMVRSKPFTATDVAVKSKNMSGIISCVCRFLEKIEAYSKK